MESQQEPRDLDPHVGLSSEELQGEDSIDLPSREALSLIEPGLEL